MRGATVTPISAPNDWLVTLPNADCATTSTYPLLAPGAVCACATPPSTVAAAVRWRHDRAVRCTSDRIVSTSSEERRYRLNWIAAWPVKPRIELSNHGTRTTSV